MNYITTTINGRKMVRQLPIIIPTGIAKPISEYLNKLKDMPVFNSELNLPDSTVVDDKKDCMLVCSQNWNCDCEPCAACQRLKMVAFNHHFSS